MLHHTKCEKILEQIVARAKPKRVLLFGSAISGKNHANDLDFLIVVADGVPTRQIAQELYRSIQRHGIAVDLVVVTESEFILQRDDQWSVVSEAHRKGRELYVAETT